MRNWKLGIRNSCSRATAGAKTANRRLRLPFRLRLRPERIVCAVVGATIPAWGINNAAAFACPPTPDATYAGTLSYLMRNGIVTTFRLSGSSLWRYCKSTARTSSGCTPTRRAIDPTAKTWFPAVRDTHSLARYGAVFDYKWIGWKTSENLRFNAMAMLFWDGLIVATIFHDPTCECGACRPQGQPVASV